MLQSKHQFGDVEPRSLLTEASFLLKMPKEFPATLKIRYKIEVRIGLEAELKPDQEWRVQRTLQNFPFADSVCDLLLSNDLLL